MSDTITVLRCARGLRLAKLITPAEIIPYDNTKTYDAWTFPVDSLDVLAALLDRLVCAPRCCIVRGELINGPVVKGIMRRVHPDPETRELPTLRDVPRQWLAIDVEGLARPEHINAADIATCGRLAVEQLPAQFHGVACVAQATAGHGIKPGIRLRLWYWLSRPATGRELKLWLKGCPADPSIFGAAQPIFTAAPVFSEGTKDHLPERLAMIRGAETVEVPSAAALAPPPRPQPKPLPEVNSLAASKYATAALRGAAARVATAPIDSRHPTGLAQSRSLARLVEAGLLARHDVERVMVAAFVQAGKTEEEGAKVVAWALAHPSTAALPEDVA